MIEMTLMTPTSKKGIYGRRRLSKMASRHCCKGHKSTYSTDHERIFLLILLFFNGHGYGQVQAANSSDSFK
jgi:hypothetical protein